MPKTIPHAQIRALLARYGVTPARVQRVAHLGMQVIRITPQGASAGGDLALRVYGQPGPAHDQIESELRWLQAMAEAGLHVPAPLHDHGGQWRQSLAWTEGAAPHDAVQYLKHPLRPLADHSAAYPGLRDELLNGYATLRALPDGFEAQIEACLGMRVINTREWVLDDWPRPDHRAWGTGFLAECGEIFAGYAR